MRLEPLDDSSHQRLVHLAAKANYRLIPTNSVQPRQTSIIDLTQDDATILARMHSKHRYNLRIAERFGVNVSIYSENLTNYFPHFWELLSQTASRQGFRTHPKHYYVEMLRALEPEGMVHLLFAEHADRTLATLLLITYAGTATYLHGGSAADGREVKAPNKLHWEAIQLAKRLHCTQYDLWGVEAVQDSAGHWVPREGHASEGVSRLKLGFGGDVVNYPGCFDVVIDPFWYSAYKSIRALRSHKRAFQ